MNSGRICQIMLRSCCTKARRFALVRPICKVPTRASLIGRFLSAPSATCFGEEPKTTAEEKGGDSKKEGDYYETPLPNTGPELFSVIVENLKEKGYLVILPKSEYGGKETISNFLSAGIRPKVIFDVFTSHPELFLHRPSDWRSKLEIFLEAGCEPETAWSILIRQPELLKMSVETILEHLRTLGHVGIKGEGLPRVLGAVPAILTKITPEQIWDLANDLKNFFTTAEVVHLFEHSPMVLFQKFDDLEAKYEYIYYHMGLEGKEFRMSHKWPVRTLLEIKTRHEFLVRCGAYVQPNPKRPMLSKDNPGLRIIMDSSDRYFATRVACLSMEEFQVFKEMFARQEELNEKEGLDLDEEEIEDKDDDLIHMEVDKELPRIKKHRNR